MKRRRPLLISLYRPQLKTLPTTPSPSPNGSSNELASPMTEPKLTAMPHPQSLLNPKPHLNLKTLQKTPQNPNPHLNPKPPQNPRLPLNPKAQPQKALLLKTPHQPRNELLHLLKPMRTDGEL